jgi:hypothetical protein
MRIRPQDITPTTQSPFMTVHAARVTHPIAEMLTSDELFLSVRNNLRAGDRVDLCRYDSGDWNEGRILEYATVLITQKTPQTVEFRLLGAITAIEVAKPVAPPPASTADDRAELEVIPGDPQNNGGFLVRETVSGHVHKHFKSRVAADRYVADYGSKAQVAA